MELSKPGFSGMKERSGRGVNAAPSHAGAGMECGVAPGASLPCPLSPKENLAAYCRPMAQIGPNDHAATPRPVANEERIDGRPTEGDIELAQRR